MATETTERRYLIFGPSWVGDMVMAQSLFKTLKQNWPGCEIDVIAPKWSQPILARMPELRRSIEFGVGHGKFGLGERRRQGHSLRDADYTHAIVIPRSFKSALVPWFARVPLRTGYLGEQRYGLLNDIRKLDKSVLTQTVQRYVALGLPADESQPPPTPRPALHVDPQRQKTLMEQNGLPTPGSAQRVVALIPGAEYGPAKQWPAQHFRSLASTLTHAGHTCWVLGSEKETELGQQIAANLENCHNLCGKTELVDVVDLLAAADWVVSNDSGLMHIAAAVGTPLTAIYGSTTPDFTPPLTDQATALVPSLSCSPCFKRHCPLGHTNCLVMRDPDEVQASIVFNAN